MSKYTFAVVAGLFFAGCGGGGDVAGEEIEFGAQAPSEATLCSFTVGRTTRAEVEARLGEPTSFSDEPSGSTVQYWYGSTADPTHLRMLVLSFDQESTFEHASTTQIPYPTCWRDEEASAADTL